MTQKRFDYTAYDDGTESIYDREKDEYYFDIDLLKIEELMNELVDENEQLKQSNNEAIELILDGIVEMHDGKRDYAETIFNKAIKLLKGDV